MLTFLRKFTIVFLLLLSFFFIFKNTSFAQQYGDWYPTYPYNIPGIQSANTCAYGNPCGWNIFLAADCSFDSYCPSHHTAPGSCTTGSLCARRIMLNDNATCINTSIQRGATGNVIADYTTTCASPPFYGIQFYIPTPTPTPSCGLSATQQQCNSSGTAWVDVATNVCKAPSACSVAGLSCTNLINGVCSATHYA